MLHQQKVATPPKRGPRPDQKRGRAGLNSIQNEMPLRIIRPKKMAAKDRPNTCAVTRSLVCAVTRSLVFVMTSIPAFRFFVLSKEMLERGWVVAPAYVSSGQVSEGTQNYTPV